MSSVSSVVKYKFPFSKEVCRNKLKSHYFAHFSAEMNEILSYYKVEKGSSSNLVVISFLFQLSSSFLILLKVVDMFAF